MKNYKKPEDYEKEMSLMGAVIIAAVITIIFLMSTSCRTQKCYPERIEVEKEVIIHHRDTTIVTEADSASMVALLECDSNFNIVLNDLSIANGDRLSLQAQLYKMQKNGKSIAGITVECHEDSLRQYIQWLETEINQRSTETIVKEVEVVKEKKVNSGFAKFCIWFFFLVILYFVGKFGFKLFKKYYLLR